MKALNIVIEFTCDHGPAGVAHKTLQADATGPGFALMLQMFEDSALVTRYWIYNGTRQSVHKLIKEDLGEVNLRKLQ